MDCRVPSSAIIPEVAARLKYYLAVERKETGFDLSVNQKDSNGKLRLYQSAGRHTRPPPQRLKENFLDNKLKASLRSYVWRCGAGWNKKVDINPNHRQQVQKRIREKMSSLTVPERFARNDVFLRDMNWKGGNWTVYYFGIDRSPRQAVSNGEFKRLISSAANLIVATTSEDDLQDLHQHRRNFIFRNIRLQEKVIAPHGITWISALVPATSENIDYEIVVHITAKSEEETTPSLYIQLYGGNGRSHPVYLHNPLAITTASSTGQAFIYHVEARDVGELTDLSIRITDKAHIWYCKKVTVKKGTKVYIFLYNNWLSPSKTIKAQVTGQVSAAARAQTATYRDTKSCQMKKVKCRPTTSKARHGQNPTCVASSEKLEFPQTKDGKEETSRKENNGDSESSTFNNKKLPQSQRTAEGKTSLNTGTLIRKYGSSERRPWGTANSKTAKGLVSSGKTKTSRDKSNQVTWMADKRCITLTSDDSKEHPLLGENNMADVTCGDTSSVRDLTMQNNIQPPKYRRASSPASYAFFAVENKETSVIVQENECTKRYTQDGAKSRILKRVSCEHANIGVPCSGEDKDSVRFQKGSSELALLREILSESKNNVTSGGPKSQPFSSRKNMEERRTPHRADDDDDVINEGHGHLKHISDYNKLCSQVDCEAIKRSTNGRSCGECSSYETDSTLDEEYIFSDTLLDRSLAEDDFDSSSKFDVFRKGPEHNQDHNVGAPGYKHWLVNIDQQNTFGKTALHYAVEKGNPKTINSALQWFRRGNSR